MSTRSALLRVGKGILRCIYAPMKLLPVRDRITFISRQTDTPSLDFRMLSDRIREKYPRYEIITLCRTIPHSAAGMISYAFHILTQMRYIATSRVVVLDTYCIPVSVLRHHDSLRVVQLWHALGAFKRFGLSVAGEDEGTSLDIVQAMDMHKNYDLVVASGNACVLPFSEAFGTPPERFIPVGLPRVDYLTLPQYVEPTRARVYDTYPKLGSKPCILYVPTFRRSQGRNDYDIPDAVDRVVKAVDLSRFDLIVKTHSGEELVYAGGELARGSRFLGMELISVADHVISDYSSIIFEAGIAGKPLYLYCYDRDEYVSSRGFYLDYDRDIPAVISRDIGEIMQAISEGRRADSADEERFLRKYVDRSVGSVTDTLAAIIDESARGVYDGRFNYKGE